jgi:WD40 repeat protein
MKPDNDAAPQVQLVKTLTGHQGSIYKLLTLPDGSLLSAGSEGIIAQWHHEKSDDAAVFAKTPASVYAMSLLCGSTILAVGTGAGSIHFIDTAARQELKILQLHKAQIFDLATSESLHLGFSAGGDGQLAVFDTRSLNLIMIKQLHPGKIRNIKISNSGDRVAIAGGDETIRIFSLPEMEEITVFKAHLGSANALLWSPDDAYLWSGGRDAHIRIWDTKAYRTVQEIPAHNYAVYDFIQLRKSGFIISVSRDKTVKLWNMQGEFQLRLNAEQYNGHKNSVNTLCALQGEKWATAGDDRLIKVWGTT